MIFYRGVIEDNADPLQIGRVKVRIYGMHTPNCNKKIDDFEFIDVEHLPWAEVMGGTQFGLISGVGVSNVLRKGTWVWVVLQQDNPDTPIVIGTISGIIQTPGVYADGHGFNDPDGVYPISSYVGSSDFNTLATGNKYGKTSVLQTPSGHQIILDDTSGSELITIKHKGGAYITLDSTGNLTVQVNNSVNITAPNKVTIKAPNIELNP